MVLQTFSSYLQWFSWKIQPARIHGMCHMVSALTLCVVAVWSAVNVAGTRLQELHPDIGKPNDPENWNQVHRDVINRSVL